MFVKINLKPPNFVDIMLKTILLIKNNFIYLAFDRLKYLLLSLII